MYSIFREIRTYFKNPRDIYSIKKPSIAEGLSIIIFKIKLLRLQQELDYQLVQEELLLQELQL